MSLPISKPLRQIRHVEASTVREQIWQTMIPGLSAAECRELAARYDLSGGQMENVSRKFTINAILYGSGKDRMEILCAGGYSFRRNGILWGL